MAPILVSLSSVDLAGFQPDHWQNQRCPAGPDHWPRRWHKKNASHWWTCIHICRNMICWRMLGQKKWGGNHKGPMNGILFLNFNVMFVTYWRFLSIVPHLIMSDLPDPPSRLGQEYDSKLASAAKALGQLKRSLDGRHPWSTKLLAGCGFLVRQITRCWNQWNQVGRSIGITMKIYYTIHIDMCIFFF